MFTQFRTFLFLFVFSAAVGDVVCETFTIVPAESSTLCPDQEICYTLNEYVSNSSLSSDLDTITLEFQPGTHTLDIPLAVNGISSFTMRGIDTTTLECEERFSMASTIDVILRGMTFINCGGRESISENSISAVTNLILKDSLFQTDEPYYIQRTTNIQIINSTFTRSPRGVLSIDNTASVLIRNCTFSDNIEATFVTSAINGLVSSGGPSSSVTIEATIFRNNHMQTIGAFQGSGHRLTVVNSTFVENSGGPSGAGAIYSDFESVTISRSEFSGNYAQDSAGAVTITGGNTVAIITNRTVFFNNTSIGGRTSGGAVDVQSAERSIITVEDSSFRFNNGTFGGAFGFITSDDSSILFSDCNFTQNTGSNQANINGGAVEILGDNVSLSVQRSRFSGNTIPGSGGAMHLHGDLRMVLINESIFENNSANDAGAISVFYFGQSTDSTLKIANSIFTSNNADISCGVLSVSSSLLCQEHLLHSRTIQVISSEFISNTQNLSNQLGSGAICFSYTNASLVNSIFSRNSQRALTVRENGVTVDMCIFNDNYVQRDGGAVYGRNINGTFNQSVFTNNRAGSSGGAVYLTESQVAFYDSTFRSNVAARGGAVAIDNGHALEIDDSNVFSNNTSTLGSVISACDDTKIDINVSSHLIASVDSTTSKTCVIYLNNAKSTVQMSLMSFTIFISSVIILVLF